MALKKSIFLFTFFFLCLQAFSQQKRIVSQYTLENGLEVYLLEDSSDALVHINFNCKAGFSYHNQDDAGFFTLYSRLINAIFSQGEFSEVSCNADFTSYKIETAYSQTENILESLSRVFFSPQISDELLSTELTKFQNEISANAREMSTFINASIDSKVFASAPWKNDSGIYPPLFKRTTEQEARNKIKYISENFYTPQNSAIFIYGNINSQKLLTILKYTFGRYYSTASLPKNQTSALVNSQRRYVLHDSEISPDLTQVVIQYTMLSMEECDLLADVLNNDYSTFKQELLKSSELNIPGSEYINVASVSKGGSSRLIIQALIQKPEKRNTIPEDFGIKPEYEGIAYDLIVDGKVMKENLKKLDKDYNWLEKKISECGVKPEEILLATVFGGALLGAGVGTIIYSGGCVDGTESVAIVISKKTNLSVGQIILIFNLFIYGTAGFIFGFDRAMYSLLTYFITYKVIDIVSEGLDQAKAAMIITDKGTDLSKRIYKKLGRTTTSIKGTGLISGEKEVLYCVLTRGEVFELKKIVEDIDESAFVSILEVSDIIGNHIKSRKKVE